nr:amidohydrolase family protein [Clostridia bacterium]
SQHLRPPEPREIDCLLDEAGDILVRCSAAPELPGAAEMARKMRLRGIRLALAHSDATCEQVLEAFGWGFTHITHLYSSTPSVHKVDQRVHAGVVEAAYLLDDMTVELIGDGRHVPKELLQVTLKIKGRDRVMLISDAMRAAGTEATESYLGAICPENRVIIEDGVAKLPDRSFYAGSVAMPDHIFRVMVREYGLSIADACHAMCQVPARHLGLEASKGSIAAGKDADLVILSPSLELEYVLSRGRVARSPRPTQEEAQTSCPYMLA